jgi:hypothetical protein
MPLSVRIECSFESAYPGEEDANQPAFRGFRLAAPTSLKLGRCHGSDALDCQSPQAASGKRGPGSSICPELSFQGKR